MIHPDRTRYTALSLHSGNYQFTQSLSSTQIIILSHGRLHNATQETDTRTHTWISLTSCSIVIFLVVTDLHDYGKNRNVEIVIDKSLNAQRRQKAL